MPRQQALEAMSYIRVPVNPGGTQTIKLLLSRIGGKVMTFRRLYLVLATLCVITALVVTNMAAQARSAESATGGTDTDQGVSTIAGPLENPLRPADTSSPRALLRSFTEEFKVFISEFDEGQIGTKISPEGLQAFYRAASTLDFSTTPDSKSWEVIMTRIVLLHEILARIALPPDNAIPGEDDVAQDGLARWTIPGSQIHIQRVAEGLRAGAFLFSAWTVQRLPRFYWKVKHLPYKPGAIPDIYETMLRSQETIINREAAIRNRLRPVDTTSPRSTLQGFLYSVNRAYALATETNAALRDDPPAITLAEARKNRIEARNYMRRAQATLDLRQVAPAIRDKVAAETVLELKELLDRMALPPIETVYDLAMVRKEQARLNGAGPVRWRYPNTNIEIVEILEGARQGQFLFSAASVRRLKTYHDRVQNLPYRPDYLRNQGDYISPEKSEGFHAFYISTPGYLVPQLSFLGRLVEGLPGGFHKIYRDQTAWQWIALILTILLVVATALVTYLVIKRLAEKLGPPLDEWLKLLTPLAVAAFVFVVINFISNDLNITGSVLLVVSTAGSALISALLAWAVYDLCRAVAQTIIALPQVDPESVRASLLNLSSRIIGALLFAWVLVEGLRALGVNVVPLVASLGVGGLAVALAARPTMENIISSFMIYLDKPFRVGQRVNVLGQDGTVEAIGLRSTRIRLLTGPQTTIPNEKMVTAEVQNIGRRPYIRRLFNVTITYDTPPEKIVRAVAILREILAVPEEDESAVPAKPLASMVSPALAAIIEDAEKERHPNEAINQEDFPPRVYFNELNADSLNIIVIYWYHPPEYWPYLEHANWINIQIMERFNDEGIDFAFPTQTLHLAGDDNRPLTVGQRWESEEETFSPSAVLAQAAALGAQVAQIPPTPASDAVRPEAKDRDDTQPKVEGELTGAPLEDDFLTGEADGEGEDDR